MNSNELTKLRIEINEIDEKIVELFKKRMQVVEKIARCKIANTMEVLDESREESVIRKHTESIEDPLLKEDVKELLRAMIKISRDAQKEIKNQLY
ncbi:MAG: chorismate mutase [Clostridiaceae bacterium]